MGKTDIEQGKSGGFRGKCGQVVHFSIIVVVHFSIPFFASTAKNSRENAKKLLEYASFRAVTIKQKWQEFKQMLRK